jgi:TPR repeat protein
LGVERDAAAAAAWWQQGAVAGDHDAQAMYGAALHLGRGVPPDPVAALAWLLLGRRGGSKLAASFIPQALAALSPEQVIEARRRAQEEMPDTES